MLKGWRLPSECDRVLVKSHVEKPIITVGLPAKNRLYVFKDAQEIEYAAPPLLLVFQSASNTTKIFQYSERNEKLYLKPYNIGNLDDSYGYQICYGHNNVKPRCPKTANSLYWSIPFNSLGELTSEYDFRSYNYKIKKDDLQKVGTLNQERLARETKSGSSLILSRDYKASPEHEDVVIIATQDDRIPDKYYSNGVAIGFARTKGNKNLAVRFGKNLTLTLSLSEVIFA